MFKRIAAVLAAALAGVIGFAVPANASTVYGCPDAYLCFYEHIDYNHTVPSSAGQYKFHVQALYPIPSTCLNFPNSGQPVWTGGQVNNKISSLILNGLEVSGGDQFYVVVFDGSNCTGDPYAFTASSGVGAVNNLTYIGWPSGGVLNDRITSVRLDWG